MSPAAHQGRRRVEHEAEVCPRCGVPCSGTYSLVYNLLGTEYVFEVEQPFVERRLGAWVDASSEHEDYSSQPSFIRDWNECTGWWKDEQPSGTLVDIDLVERVFCASTDDGTPKSTKSTVQALRRFIAASRAHGASRLRFTSD